MKDKVSPTNEENILDANSEDSSSSENQDANSEDSSNSGKSEPAKSTLDVVKEALNVDKEGEDEQEKDDKTDKKDVKSNKKDGTSDKEENESDDEIPEDEKNLIKVKTRKRIEQLQHKFREEKDLRVKLEKERDEYKTDAVYYKQFRDFLGENNISTQEANTLFDIGAMMKRDPLGALKAITPYYNSLLEVTGHILPADLKDKVDKGYITEEAAHELSVNRASVNVYRNRESENYKRQQSDEVARNQHIQLTNMQSAIANLEKGWGTSDPDYKQKSTRISERIKLRLFEARASGSLPRTPDEAVRLAETVKREVDKELSSFFVKKKPIDMVDGGNGGGTNKPVPKNTLDVIRQVVGG